MRVVYMEYLKTIIKIVDLKVIVYDYIKKSSIIWLILRFYLKYKQDFYSNNIYIYILLIDYYI